MDGGHILLGITNNSAIMKLNGMSNFIDGIVKEPSIDDITFEIEKRIKVAKSLGFCDLIMFWPIQYIMQTKKTDSGKKYYEITERKPLDFEELAEICGRFDVFFSFM